MKLANLNYVETLNEETSILGGSGCKPPKRDDCHEPPKHDDCHYIPVCPPPIVPPCWKPPVRSCGNNGSDT